MTPLPRPCAPSGWKPPSGKIKFDERGDAIGAGFSIYQVKDGVYVELK